MNVTSFLGALETQLAEWQKWGEAKSQEYNQLLEAYNGYVAAHTAQAQEISSLKESQNHLSEEIEKMREAVEAKEAEISELKVQSRDASVQESSTTSKNVDAKVDQDEDDGWGDPSEDDVVVPDVDDRETICQLEREVSELRDKLNRAEAEKKSLDDEVTAAKVKSGKLTLKVKNLTKEVETLKKKGKGSTAGMAT